MFQKSQKNSYPFIWLLRCKNYASKIMAGANVIMPSVTPEPVRTKYFLYNNKNALASAENILFSDLQLRLEKIGYTLEAGRGDYREEEYHP